MQAFSSGPVCAGGHHGHAAFHVLQGRMSGLEGVAVCHCSGRRLAAHGDGNQVCLKVPASHSVQLQAQVQLQVSPCAVDNCLCLKCALQGLPGWEQHLTLAVLDRVMISCTWLLLPALLGLLGHKQQNSFSLTCALLEQPGDS